MKSILTLTLATLTTFAGVAPSLSAAAPPSPSHHLWYQQPANNWQMEALPIGNGKLGAMVFGKVEQERFMLNEDTLWIGDENDTGSYQSLGNLYISLHPAPFSVSYDTPNQHQNGSESVQRAFDGKSNTKWCFEKSNRPIIANIKLFGKSTPLTGYSLTSGNDAPERDPSDWKLQASNDGKTWKTLDERHGQPQWEKRQQSKHFQVKNRKAYTHYRFVFASKPKVSHFQIADITLDLKPLTKVAPFADYQRDLDLKTAIHTTRYTRKGIHYQREAFSSAPAGVMVFHFTADQKASHTGSLEFKDSHQAPIQGKGNTLIAAGNLKGFKYGNEKRSDKETYKIALDYESQVKVLHHGGQVKFHQGKIYFKNCDSLTVLVASGTDYLNQRDKGWKGEHPHKRLTQQIAKASATPYEQLKQQHIADYQSLYNRCEATLPENKNSQLPTDKRLIAYQKDRSDYALEALQMHYARYLMIASSRPGSMPANLQGLWNESNNPPWRCDYHSDVNLQMNYWFVDQTNLSECFQPYADYQSSVRATRRDRTKKHYGNKIRGWATQSENGIFGGASYLWVPGDAAWLTQNIWDHYAYTRDKTYLKKTAYPIIKELCQFWEDFLVTLPDGTLVSPKSVSPEHGPAAIGNSYEQQLVYDLFTNFIEASTDLGIDADYRKKVAEMRSKLLKPKIGRWGQLQEWMKDIDDPKDQHRHLSHLIAVYPGRQIAPTTTPKLAKAAATSLDHRGDSGTGWSIGWKINLWARLLDGDHAHRILQNSLKEAKTTQIVMNYAGGTYPNLLMAHPPFQIEANFGYASGFCELLMQSHLGEIHLLPALPTAWPNGKITGLKARGNVIVDIEWENGKLKHATLTPQAGSLPPIRVGSEKHTVNPKSDTRITVKR